MGAEESRQNEIVKDVIIRFDNPREARLFTAAYEMQRFIWVDGAVSITPKDAASLEKFENLSLALNRAIEDYPKTVVGEREISE